MTRMFFELLWCPVCKQRFTEEQIIKKKDDSILYGTIKCNCSSYPIVDGIFIYKHDKKTSVIRKLIHRKKLWKAWKVSLDYRRDLNRLLMITAANASLSYRLTGWILCLITFSRSRVNFPLFRLLDLAGKLRIDIFWTTYLKHRFSATSFWCTLPYLKLVNPSSSFVLDVGSGMGVFSYMMSKQISQSSIVCQNLEFAGLYIARKYFVPNSNFICSDAGEPQPFADSTFNVVFSCDALQFVAKKEDACRQIVRLVHQTAGIVILAHNHNPAFRDFAGQGPRGDFFHPRKVRSMFENYGLTTMLFDEEAVFWKLFSNCTAPDKVYEREK